MDTKTVVLGLLSVGLTGYVLADLTNTPKETVVTQVTGPVSEVCHFENTPGRLDREPCEVETLQDRNGFDYYLVTDKEGTTVKVNLYNNGNAEVTHMGYNQTVQATFVEKNHEATVTMNGTTFSFTF